MAQMNLNACALVSTYRSPNRLLCSYTDSARKMFYKMRRNGAFQNLSERRSFNISPAVTFPGKNCDRCFMMLLSPSAVTRVKFQCQFYAQCFKGLSGDAEGIAGIENLTLDEQSLELELQSAIEAENYARAAKLRDELQLLQKDNRAGVLAANARFYRAFEKGDLSAMQMIWSKGDNVHCVHPGAGCISGYDLVMESWELTFGPELDLPLQIELQNVEVHIKGKLGFVTCLELIRTSGNNWGKQVATNVFENVDGSWYICLHHASYVSS